MQEVAPSSANPFTRNLVHILLELLDEQRRMATVCLEATNNGGSRVLLDDMEALLSCLSRDVESVRQDLACAASAQRVADPACPALHSRMLAVALDAALMRSTSDPARKTRKQEGPEGAGEPAAASRSTGVDPGTRPSAPAWIYDGYCLTELSKERIAPFLSAVMVQH